MPKRVCKRWWRGDIGGLMLQAFMPHLVAPELVESNVLAEWASHRRPRTRPERTERPYDLRPQNVLLDRQGDQIRIERLERPQNMSAERARSGVPDISQRTGVPRRPIHKSLSICCRCPSRRSLHLPRLHGICSQQERCSFVSLSFLFHGSTGCPIFSRRSNLSEGVLLRSSC